MSTFKQAKRKNLKTAESRIDYIQRQLNGIKDSIVERVGESDFDKIVDILTKATGQISDEIKSLPVRHEYKGVFYIRKPYTVPTESIKVNGRASMREDLVTWEVRDQDEKYLVATRDIFKDSKLSNRIIRENGEAIFQDRQI